MSGRPIVVFSDLKGFPLLMDGEKISTQDFLEASREIVTQIDGFGKIFAPIVYDMNKNIEKLDKVYKQNITKNMFLEDMILQDLTRSNNVCPDALLWLKRALELIEHFFRNIFNDKSCEENLKPHMQEAYYQTLRTYHSWFTQEAFSLIYRFIPYRSELVGKGNVNDANMKNLELFINALNAHLNQINLFFVVNSLDTPKRV